MLKVTGARTGGEPSGAHWYHRAEARDTAGARGGIQILGMVMARPLGGSAEIVEVIEIRAPLPVESAHPMFVTAPVLEYPPVVMFSYS